MESHIKNILKNYLVDDIINIVEKYVCWEIKKEEIEEFITDFYLEDKFDNVERFLKLYTIEYYDDDCLVDCVKHLFGKQTDGKYFFYCHDARYVYRGEELIIKTSNTLQELYEMYADKNCFLAIERFFII